MAESYGVVLYLERQPDGQVRLTMDDVMRAATDAWHRERLFAHIDLPADDVREGALPCDVLERIADNLMLRLAVLSRSELE
jgi:hypothetical protein